MDAYEELRDRNALQTELLHQKNLVCSLQAKIELFQGEVRKSRQDVANAEQIVNMLSQKLINCEAMDGARSRLAGFGEEAERSVAQIERLQASVDFYKMKWEESINEKGEHVPMELDGSKNSRKRSHPDYDSCKVQAELNLISERLAALLKEKQQTEENYEKLLEQKDKLILELHASKTVLELKVQAQSSAQEEVEKRLIDVDKTNRKLEEQRIKASTENAAMKTNLEELRSRFNQMEHEKQVLSSENRALTSDLEKVRCEATELRSKCEVLSKNVNVSEMVANTLEEFRAASSQMNNAQLKQATEQLESLRKDNEVLVNFVKTVDVGSQLDVQLPEFTALKTTLADTELQRDNCLQECTALKATLADVQSERDTYLQECTALKTTLADFQSQLDAQSRECNSLKASLISAESQFDARLKESTALKQQQINQLMQEVQDLNEKFEKNQALTVKIREVAMKYKEGYEKLKSEASSGKNVEGTNDG